MHWIALQSAPEPPQRATPVAAAPADPCTALAWWALQFSPLVARVDDALVLEVSGSARLFGGQAALQRLILESDAPLALANHGQGATSLIAIGQLWCACQRPALPELGTDALPLPALAAARPHLPTLSRLGLSTWGQLRALPRGGLARRFGAALVEALDRAYGERPDVYPWLTLPEVFDAPLELAAAVESAPALLFGAARLLAQLRVWLRARQRGVLALELVWALDARRSNAGHVDAHHDGTSQGRLCLQTAQATQDIQHLQRLLAEQLARVTLPAPVLHLRLRTLQTQALAGDTRSLLPEDLRHGDSLHHLLERLGARLGPAQVLWVEPQQDHRPECMQRWQPWTPAAATRAADAGAGNSASPAVPGSLAPQAALQPGWLLPRPLKLALQPPGPHGSPLCSPAQSGPFFHGPLTLLAGPQRLEAGWLDGAPALRDYFVARSPGAGLVWIYRERLAAAAQGSPPAWYLHGLFA